MHPINQAEAWGTMETTNVLRQHHNALRKIKGMRGLYTHWAETQNAQCGLYTLPSRFFFLDKTFERLPPSMDRAKNGAFKRLPQSMDRAEEGAFESTTTIGYGSSRRMGQAEMAKCGGGCIHIGQK